MSLLDTASLIVTPNGYKEGKLYSVIPSDGSGDLSVTRATTATRVNSAGLIESMSNNIPRLDYSNGTCPSILVEPQRTNLIVNSSSFNSAGWLNTNSTINSNTTFSPSGIQDADTIAFGSGGYVGQFFVQTGAYSFSVYAKYIGTQWLYLQNYNGGDFGAWFDIQNGTIGTIESGVTASIEQAENGFYRCTITYNASILSSSYYVFFNTTGNGSYARTGSSYFWGAQLEAGSYATSYIPTTSASVTRNADVISKTGISSLIGQTEGTLFLDFYYNGSSIDFIPIEIYGMGRASLYVNASKILFYEVSGTSVAIPTLSPLVEGRYKMAFVYKLNDFALYSNGVLQGTFNSGAVPTMNALNISDLSVALGTYKQQIEVNTLALWKTRLTNTQLATLTTL